jgi:hypothetical protein
VLLISRKKRKVPTAHPVPDEGHDRHAKSPDELPGVLLINGRVAAPSALSGNALSAGRVSATVGSSEAPGPAGRRPP